LQRLIPTILPLFKIHVRCANEIYSITLHGFAIDAILQVFSSILCGSAGRLASNKMAYNYPAVGNPPLPPGAMSKHK